MKRITLFILLFLSSGCNTFSSSISPTSALSTDFPTVMVTTSTQPTPTLEFLTPTALPTLQPAKAEKMVLDLLQNNGGCRFPCWWGLTPGKTNSQAVISLFERLAEISLRTTVFDDVGGAHWRIDKNGLLLDTIVSFTYNRLLSDTVESLRITVEVKKELEGGGFETIWENPFNEEYLRAYRLPQILEGYGQPEQVLIFANEGWRYFNLVLDYSDQGFTVWYSAPLESSGDQYLGCMSKAFVDLYIWTPEFSYSWAEGVTGTGNQLEVDSLNRDFKSLVDVTSITLDEFYDAFGNTDNVSCIETPKELWPGP